MMSNAQTVIAILGLLAFIVNIIVELIKDLAPFKKTPTKFVAILTSFLVCVFSSLIYINYTGTQIALGLLIPTIILGTFPIAFISMYGFDTFKELYNKFKQGSEK